MSKGSVVLRVRFHVIGEFSGNLWFSTIDFQGLVFREETMVRLCSKNVDARA